MMGMEFRLLKMGANLIDNIEIIHRKQTDLQKEQRLSIEWIIANDIICFGQLSILRCSLSMVFDTLICVFNYRALLKQSS